jgi:hypothetical protein
LDRGVLDPADVHERVEVSLTADHRDPPTPLLGARDVLGLMTGSDEPAQHLAHPHEVIDVSSGGGGH